LVLVDTAPKFLTLRLSLATVAHMQTERLTGLKLIPFNEAAKRLNRSRSKLYDELDVSSEKFNPRLPRPARDAGRVGFYEHELDEYLLGVMQIRNATDPYLRSLASQEGGATDR
jgi:hypothetical protein